MLFRSKQQQLLYQTDCLTHLSANLEGVRLMPIAQNNGRPPFAIYYYCRNKKAAKRVAEMFLHLDRGYVDLINGMLGYRPSFIFSTDLLPECVELLGPAELQKFATPSGDGAAAPGSTRPAAQH